jgi:hypothetical protein
MTRRRWIADEVSSNRGALTGDHADHLIRVLRARVGQEFVAEAQDAFVCVGGRGERLVVGPRGDPVARPSRTAYL